MNILLTNDDGINSSGLKTLEKIMIKNNINVYIVAPDSEKSGSSHAVSLFKPIFYEILEKNKVHITGYPVDCVISGLKAFFKHIKFDFVLSGINKGPNIGTDIFYSGTFSAAFRAAEEGIDSFAFSVNRYNEPYGFSKLEKEVEVIFLKISKNIIKIKENAFTFYREILKNVSTVFLKSLKIAVIFNVNFPDPFEFKNFKGIKKAYLSHRDYGDIVNFFEKKGEKFFTIEGKIPEPSNLKEVDSYLIGNGYISITPIFYPSNGFPFAYPDSIEGIF